MLHRFRLGQNVYLDTSFGNPARGAYKIVLLVPIGDDARLFYRIKNNAEAFERVVEQSQISLGD